MYETPPNTQGLAALSMLNIMEQFPLKEWGHDNPKTLHIEWRPRLWRMPIMRYYVGDPRVVKVPTARLISKELAEERAKTITDRANCSVPPSEITAQLAELESDTTYLAVVDRDGNDVSLIQSNSGNFGSGLVPEDTGFVLQNRGGGFTLKPGQPNTVAPHKRPSAHHHPGLYAEGRDVASASASSRASTRRRRRRSLWLTSWTSG